MSKIYIFALFLFVIFFSVDLTKAESFWSPEQITLGKIEAHQNIWSKLNPLFRSFTGIKKVISNKSTHLQSPTIRMSSKVKSSASQLTYVNKSNSFKKEKNYNQPKKTRADLIGELNSKYLSKLRDLKDFCKYKPSVNQKEKLRGLLTGLMIFLQTERDNHPYMHYPTRLEFGTVLEILDRNGSGIPVMNPQDFISSYNIAIKPVGEDSGGSFQKLSYSGIEPEIVGESQESSHCKFIELEEKKNWKSFPEWIQVICETLEKCVNPSVS